MARRARSSSVARCQVLSHRYIERELRVGPFPLQLTDFHASNLFVDDEEEQARVWIWHWPSSVNAMYIPLEAHLAPTLSVEQDKLISGIWCTGIQRGAPEVVQ